MNLKTLLLGIGVGFAGGYAVRELYAQKTSVSPEKALANAKAVIKKDGRINGSWILMTSEPYQKDMLQYEVYRGGISKVSETTKEQYEFIADAKTGTIIDIMKLD